MWTAQSPGQGLGDPWHKLMNNQGWSISQLNDVFGLWAMHNVTWDYVDPNGTDEGPLYRQTYGRINEDPGNHTQRRLRLTQLESLNSQWQQNHRFVSPYHWAPQRWGYNIVRLYPTQSSGNVAITFRGVIQSEAHSGWRWGVVATSHDLTQTRYSALQSGSDGSLNFAYHNGEELYLVVLAAPTQFQKITWDTPADGRAYPSIYRYPYMVEISGAWPEGFRDGNLDACPSGTVRHTNGGGCATSSTPSSVYVGPYAKVLGGSVSGNARIEDHATIISGTVNGGTVGGMSLIGVAGDLYHGPASFNVGSNAHVEATFYPLGWFVNNATVDGSAHLLGDLEYYSAHKSANTFYGLVDDNWNGVASAQEVTVAPPYQWR